MIAITRGIPEQRRGLMRQSLLLSVVLTACSFVAGIGGGATVVAGADDVDATKPADEDRRPDAPEADPDAPPVKEMTAGGDEHMRYFLIGPKVKPAPAGGYRLLLVLPGGDGSDEFRPFVTNLAAKALPDGYLVAQLVAPKWHDDKNRIVWPSEKLPDPKMKFTTEAFIDAVVAEVREAHEVDAKHVYALGWSSGGPPVYAAAMRAETPLTGAFVAMSVFKPAALPPAEKLEGRAFYLLHSPADFIKMRYPEAARDTLAEAGAKTKLETYEGGHGWRGDVFGMIRAGVEWLEEQHAEK